MTDLSLDEMRRILAPLDLRPRRMARVDKGTINSNFRVDTDGGTVFVRVNEGKRESDVRYEGQLLWHLGARRFATPQPLRTATGESFVVDEGRLVTVFPWWPGREVEGADTVERASQMGEALARLHVAASDFPARRRGIYTFERIASRVEAFRAQAEAVPSLGEALPILDEELVHQKRERPRLAGLPEGTIHGDLFPDNVLWTPPVRGKPEGPVVLDFEQASYGRFVYDLAVTLLAWCWDATKTPARLDEAKAWALVSGYQRVRALSDDERQALHLEARFAALRFTVTRITDILLPSLVPGAPPPRPGKDFRDYLARLVFLREHGEDAVAPAVDTRPPLRAV